MGGFPPVRRLALPAALDRHITQRTPEKAYAFPGVLCVTKPRWSGRPCSAPDVRPVHRVGRARVPLPHSDVARRRSHRRYLGDHSRWPRGLRHPVPAPWLQCLRVRRRGARPRQLAKFPEINPVPPCFNSYAECWTTYRLGPKYPESYEGTRFDADKYDAFIKSGHDA